MSKLRDDWTMKVEYFNNLRQNLNEADNKDLSIAINILYRLVFKATRVRKTIAK